jgi:mersacidin/lichenicidin family type 2 lantibiotic
MDYIRAWKDPVYRATLSPAERESLPANPAGLVELTDSELMSAAGGTTSLPCATAVTWVAGCFTINNTYCNGTCSFDTVGCCG